MTVPLSLLARSGHLTVPYGALSGAQNFLVKV